MAIIRVSVANLRREPKHFDHDDLRESQLLFNEEIEVLSKQDEWVKVRALEQPQYVEGKGWQHYEGWVHEREISSIASRTNPTHVVAVPLFSIFSYGTYLHINQRNEIVLPNGETVSGYENTNFRPLNAPFNRDQLVKDATQFIDFPYLWGGRASYFKNLPASVDCSGLINLIYRAQGVLIPRDARDQFRESKEIEKEAMQPGDLIFLAPENAPNDIKHVILHCSKDTFLESSQIGQCVRFLLNKIHVWDHDGLFHYRDSEVTYQPYYRSLIDATMNKVGS